MISTDSLDKCFLPGLWAVANNGQFGQLPDAPRTIIVTTCVAPERPCNHSYP